MASNISELERTLLGYAPRDPFGSRPDNSPRSKSSDVDFTDVFGGPPGLSSINELRRSRADSMDLGSWRASGSGYGSGSGLGELPVFGEISSPARRRHLKDDFFSDIFQSSESACSSPRRVERDSLNSPTPGSRVLSPTRPSPPVRSEAGTRGSSLPAQLRLSMKLAKATDNLVASPTKRTLYKHEDGSLDTLPSSPTAFVPSFTTRAVTAQDDLKIDDQVLYCQSFLSRPISHSLDKSLADMDSASLSTKSYSQKNSTSLESYVSKGQFHFSIYKWAGKGVTLIMPSKSKLQNESSFKRLPEVVVQEVDMILHEDNMSTLATAGKSHHDKRLPEVVVQEVDMILHEDNMSTLATAGKSHHDNLDKSVKDAIVETKIDADSNSGKGFLPAEFESKFPQTDEAERSGNSNDEEVEAQKHDLKNLQQLFDDELEKQQNEEIIREVEGNEDFSTGQQGVPANINIKQQAGREHKRNPVKVTNHNTRDAPVSLEDKMLGSKVKGKVKAFIKIFNQEGSPKHKGTFETPGRRSRGKDEGKGKVEDPVCAPTAKAGEQVKTTSRSCDTLSDAPVPINQSSEMAEKVNFNISFDVHMMNNSLSQKNDPLRPCPDSTPDILDASECNIEETHYEDLEGCLVEPLSQDQNKDLKSNSDQDQLRRIDAKIREWSKGKEGNIRSLLSTLQYVLWPESGWRPIPLVNIIEGSSVKRAYQKALLCLHPDKLQQKGAAAQQKYTAEKVFDIMQEAWDHFNSSSQMF